MQRVDLGNTGLKVSRLCFGSLTIGPIQAALPLEQGGELLAYAISRGINFFDTAQLYETYPYIKEGMRRSGAYDVIISSKSYAYTAQQAHEAVEQARRQLDRDYIDIFMLHEQESIHTLAGHQPALEVLYDYKSKGIIKAVGLSTHHVAGVEGAVEKGLDIIHPLINKEGLGIVDGSRQQMEESIEKAHSRGIGVFAMKVLAGGNLFKEAGDCLSYALSLTGVDSIAIGMQSADEVDANIEFFEKGIFSNKALEHLAGKERRLHIDDWCIGCGDCVERCGQSALTVVGKQAVCDHGSCILCGYCCTVCPMWAIKVV